MKPTKQTILHDPANGKHGNCFSAVLASLLHVPIDAVPVFSNPSSWQLQLNEWLRPYGLCYMQIGGLKDWIDSVGIAGLHHEQAGNTLRSNDVLHSVVAVDCGPVFDPHPDDTGLTNNVANGVFVSLTPWVAASGASRIAELEAQLEAATKRKAKDVALLSGFVDALEEIAGSSSLTATPKQFAVHLQRIAKNSLLAAADALGEK